MQNWKKTSRICRPYDEKDKTRISSDDRKDRGERKQRSTNNLQSKTIYIVVMVYLVMKLKKLVGNMPLIIIYVGENILFFELLELSSSSRLFVLALPVDLLNLFPETKCNGSQQDQK